MASLKRRWGSGVMRQIDVFGEILNEWGRAILRGLSCWWSVMNFFVVRTSHSGSASASGAPEPGEVGSVARRFLVGAKTSFCRAWLLMCFKSALDALSVCSG